MMFPDTLHKLIFFQAKPIHFGSHTHTQIKKKKITKHLSIVIVLSNFAEH